MEIVEPFYYLLVNIVALVPAFILGFRKSVVFIKQWKAIFLSILICSVPFIILDAWFISIGVWSFNDRYITGLNLFGLPLEEMLFYISFPFSTIFIFEVIKQNFTESDLKNFGRLLMGAILGFSLVFILSGRREWYPLIIMISALISSAIFLFHDPKWIGHFALTYVIMLIPFFGLSAILSGTGIEDEIIWYNNKENLSMRLGTIPFENFFHGFVLLIWNCFFFNKFKKEVN